MPYLYGQAVAASRDRDAGAAADGRSSFPTTRPARISTGSTCSGDRLLVAPVFSASGETSYYLPDGVWTHLQTGATVSGPGWVHEVCDFGTVPVYVRPGSVLPVGSRSDRPDYAYAEDVTLRAYQLADGTRVNVSVPDQTGEVAAEFEVACDAGAVTVTQLRGAGGWRLESDPASAGV